MEQLARKLKSDAYHETGDHVDGIAYSGEEGKGRYVIEYSLITWQCISVHPCVSHRLQHRSVAVQRTARVRGLCHISLACIKILLLPVEHVELLGLLLHPLGGGHGLRLLCPHAEGVAGRPPEPSVFRCHLRERPTGAHVQSGLPGRG
eukprot:5905112-Pyramimonas_sp.AAC.1